MFDTSSVSSCSARPKPRQLPYELAMLHIGRNRSPVGWQNNLCIECFAIHARSVLEFFGSRGSSDNFRATDFVARHKATHTKEITGPEIKMLHDQLAHLGKRRTTETAKKLNGNIQTRMFEAIKREVTAFHKKLSPDDAMTFETGLRHQGVPHHDIGLAGQGATGWAGLKHHVCPQPSLSTRHPQAVDLPPDPVSKPAKARCSCGCSAAGKC